MQTEQVDQIINMLKQRGWRKGSGNLANGPICLGQATEQVGADFNELDAYARSQSYLSFTYMNDTQMESIDDAVEWLEQYKATL